MTANVCDACKKELGSDAILFTPPHEANAQKKLCMSCFGDLGGKDITV
jgi:hypothetical protein